MAKKDIPEKIRKEMEKKGYFKLSKSEREDANKRCFGALVRSSKGSPQGDRAALLELRGDQN